MVDKDTIDIGDMDLCIGGRSKPVRSDEAEAGDPGGLWDDAGLGRLRLARESE
jgi:hypothetical protein